MRKDHSRLVPNDKQDGRAFTARPDIRFQTDQCGKTMSELRMSLDCAFANGDTLHDGKPLSAPERELLEFHQRRGQIDCFKQHAFSNGDLAG